MSDYNLYSDGSLMIGGIDYSQNSSSLYTPGYNGTMMGLPADPVSKAPIPGLESTTSAAGSAPPISMAQRFWDTIVADTGAVYGGLKNVTKTLYGDVASGVGTVAHDVSSPIANAAQSTYWYLILGIVVVAGGLYFAGKSGALRVIV